MKPVHLIVGVIIIFCDNLFAGQPADHRAVIPNIDDVVDMLVTPQGILIVVVTIYLINFFGSKFKR